MNTKPIIFQGAMVRALIDGTKTQTRRVAKVTDEGCRGGFIRPTAAHTPRRIEDHAGYCPYGQPGTLLWVRETWGLLRNDGALCPRSVPACEGPIAYRADGEREGTWHPSIHMPRWASRLTLLVTDVRVERAQQVSEADAQAEGAEPVLVPPDGGSAPYTEGFADLWDSINAAKGYGWSDNPWVWAIGFKPIHANIDAVLADPAAYGAQQDEVPA